MVFITFGLLMPFEELMKARDLLSRKCHIPPDYVRLADAVMSVCGLQAEFLILYRCLPASEQP